MCREFLNPLVTVVSFVVYYLRISYVCVWRILKRASWRQTEVLWEWWSSKEEYWCHEEGCGRGMFKLCVCVCRGDYAVVSHRDRMWPCYTTVHTHLSKVMSYVLRYTSKWQVSRYSCDSKREIERERERERHTHTHTHIYAHTERSFMRNGVAKP